MTKQQRDSIDRTLRQTWGDSSISANGNGTLDLGGEVNEQRRRYADMMSAIPLPDDVHTEEAALGDVPVVTITVDGAAPTGTILYFHGGAYALGSASQSAASTRRDPIQPPHSASPVTVHTAIRGRLRGITRRGRALATARWVA
jgi:acetyl esterase/lipase